MAFPQADTARREVLHARKTAFVVGERDQHGDPDGCPLTSLPRTTNPSPSSHDSSPLFPPRAGAQGEWLQMGFCALACFSSRLCLSRAGGGGERQNPSWFSQPNVMWVPLPGSGALDGGAQHVVETYASQGEPLGLGFPLDLQLLPGSRATLSCSAFPPSLRVAPSVSPGL